MHGDTIKRIFIFFLIFILALSGCISGEKSDAPSIEWDLSLSGNVDTEIIMTYDELLDMEKISYSAELEKTTGTIETHFWEGVSLELLFGKTGISPNVDRVVVSAFDGYTVTLLPSDMEGGMIAYKMDGEYLPDDEPLRLVVPKMWGPAWMRGITMISFESTEGLLEISGDAKSPQLLDGNSLSEYNIVNFSYESAVYEGVLIEDLLAVARYIYDSTDIIIYDIEGAYTQIPISYIMDNQNAIIEWENSSYKAVIIGSDAVWMIDNVKLIEVATL